MFRHAGYLVEALGERFENATTQDFALSALAITLIAWFCTKYYGPDP
jgi:hypothetical protein